MGLWQAGRAVVAVSPAANVSQGKSRQHRQPEPGSPGEQRCSLAGMGTGGQWGWHGKQPGQHPRDRAAARGYFHEIRREILSGKGDLGVPRREAGFMMRRHPAAGPAGLGELAKAPVILTSTQLLGVAGCLAVEG